MRQDVLDRSLRGLRLIQRRRLRGLMGLGSFTTPMIAGGGSVTSYDASSSGALFAAPAHATVPTTSVLSTPLLALALPLSRMVPTAPPVPRSTGYAVPGVFDPEAGFTPADADPLGAGEEIATAAGDASSDRAGAGTDVYVPGGDPAPVTSDTTKTLWERYKWWIAGFLFFGAGAGGWLAWRSVRRRR